MISKEKIYSIAFENKAAILKEKQRQHEILLSAAYSSVPRLKEIDNTLADVGSQIAITALKGDTEKLKDLQNQSKALSAEKTLLLQKSEVKDIVYDCDLCCDTGYISGKICNCIKQEAAKVTANELSKQMPLNECTFEKFDLKYYSDKPDINGNEPKKRMTAILKYCREYVINFSPETSTNLLFTGRAGLGKTHLTLAIVSGVIEKGYIPVYASAENLFTAIENEKFAHEGKGTYETVLNCDLLVIDDLGTEMVTSFTKSVLYNLVNTRILSHKPTIINTNLSMKQIEDIYSERIVSRFIGNYESKKFLGEDIRQQKALKV